MAVAAPGPAPDLLPTAGLPAVVDFDALRAVVRPGAGLVLRFPGVLGLVLETGDPVPLGRLLDICADVTAGEPGAPGRVLARRLAGWLMTSGASGPGFATVAATETGIGVFLHGPVDAVLGRSRLSGADAGAWTDRLLPAPDGPIALVPAGYPAPAGEPERAVLDLRAGVVPGGAVVLAAPGGAPLPAHPAEESTGDLPVGAPPTPPAADAPAEPAGSSPGGPAEPAPQPARKRALPPPQRAEAIFGVPPEEPRRAPLDSGLPAPSAGPAGGSAAPGGRPVPDGPLARGFECSRGHLNDPRNQFCIICGIRMDERTGVVVLGVRPPLGLLVFDDGSTFTVDADYLLGRMPESDERVRSGALRPVPVADPQAQVSRAHLRIALDGWDVTATDESRNGTFVARPGEQSWSRLPPRQPVRLVPGTRIRVGGRGLIFESPSGVR